MPRRARTLPSPATIWPNPGRTRQEPTQISLITPTAPAPNASCVAPSLGVVGSVLPKHNDVRKGGELFWTPAGQQAGPPEQAGLLDRDGALPGAIFGCVPGGVRLRFREVCRGRVVRPKSGWSVWL